MDNINTIFFQTKDMTLLSENVDIELYAEHIVSKKIDDMQLNIDILNEIVRGFNKIKPFGLILDYDSEYAYPTETRFMCNEYFLMRVSDSYMLMRFNIDNKNINVIRREFFDKNNFERPDIESRNVPDSRNAHTALQSMKKYIESCINDELELYFKIINGEYCI